MSGLSIGVTVCLRSDPGRQGVIRDFLAEDDGSWVLVTWSDLTVTAHLEEDLEAVAPSEG